MATSRKKEDERYSANDIYAAVRNENDYLQKIEPVDDIHLTFESSQLDQQIDGLAKHIRQLREQDFDGYIIDRNGARILVKYHDADKNAHTYKLNPIHIHEAEVQAQRYLRGMLLIVKHLEDDARKATVLSAAREIYERYEQNKQAGHDPADLTLRLADEFTQSLAAVLQIGYEKAGKQLTMARDLGIMLEDHPSVCTISEEKDRVTIEKSTPYKISESYYADPELFGNLAEQNWFKSAKSLAGLGMDEAGTWLERFFAQNLDELKRRGVTAPPSARWLPVPANNQIVEMEVAQRRENSAEMEFSHTQFMRTGVAIAYDVRRIPGVTVPEPGPRGVHEKLIDKVIQPFRRPTEEQKKIARKILRELITSQLGRQIQGYKAVYGDVIDPANFNFYVNYQTLLSPLIGEARFGHVDNNARFVKLVKEVMSELAGDEAFKQEYKTRYGANLHITHTNSAVNRNAHLTNEWSQDERARREKIAELDQIKKNVAKTLLSPDIDLEQVRFSQLRQPMLEAGYNKKLVNELVRREEACQSLRLLLDGQPPFDKLRRYQRNIMMAALEHLAMGSQSYTLAGCKSARDRTGVFACAVKVMQENPAAMRNWKVLERGIVKSLKQGHAFRSMIFHSAIVKVSLVHKRFTNKLRQPTQKAIKTLLVFSRTLDKYEKEKGLQAQALPEVRPVQGALTSGASAALSKQDAQHLLIASGEETSRQKLEAGRNQWAAAMRRFAADVSAQGTVEGMDRYLSGIREKHLDTKSFVEYPRSNPGLKVRIYPHKPGNVNTGANDFFASGIDSARGALMILQHGEVHLDEKKKILAKLQVTLNVFQRRMALLEKRRCNTDEMKLVQLEQAREEYKKFNGALSSLLVEAGCYPDYKTATHGMMEARDLIWIMSRKDESVCTVRHDNSGHPAALSFARRMNFPAEDMRDYENQPWFEQFHGAHPWAKAFFASHPEALTLSATPMQRSLPNPANAWEEATILIGKDGSGNDAVDQIITGVRMGISSPYQVREKEERQRLANRNHLLMFTDSRLLEHANRHMEVWKGLHPANEITIPILHQTLVDPGSPRYLACRTGENPRDMIWRKHLANKELQEYLQHKNIYYDKLTGAVVMDPPMLSDDLIRIKFVVKETNNGVNVYEKMTDKSLQDYSCARDLVFMAKDKLQLLHIRLKQEMEGPSVIGFDDFHKVIGFLSSVNSEQPRRMEDDEAHSLKKICDDLLEGKYNTIANPSTQKNLALLIQAAANLASFLSNDIGTSVVGFVSDGAMMMNPVAKSADINDATYKACYERILAEMLGVRMGGCKSALDREQEVAELTNAMYRQFQAEGRIVNYHDSMEEKQRFLTDYVNTQHKHNMCEMITGIPGSSDRETQGLAYRQETSYEQKASSLLERGCRHPRPTAFSHEQYISENKSKKISIPGFLHMFKKKPQKSQKSAVTEPVNSPHNRNINS
ncbi:hypothetical protein AQUSIP_19120 [Aquicella siphonis]|uniref:Uncharacterized protein n=1 Tax=Aquicella siphonis TaxID=254247 RepID=A0A5E4PHT4_9COXI|nr:hypothetical protein [Aquicella siphonis]VVC76590.1 hypothetical protein AQUSIP_19120 [Aquicella siphonis]